MAWKLARALLRAGTEPSPEEPLPVPADLQGVLSAPMAALPAGARRCPAGGLVPAVADDSHAGAGEWPIGAGLAADGGRPGVVGFEGARVRFTHPLFASVIYSASRLGGAGRCTGGWCEIAPTVEERARHLACPRKGRTSLWLQRWSGRP
jgi:hypothetical protein